MDDGDDAFENRYYLDRAINYEVMKRLPTYDLVKFAYDRTGPALRQEIYNSQGFWYDKSVDEYGVISPQLDYDWRQIYHFISGLEDFNPRRLRWEDLRLDDPLAEGPVKHLDVIRYYLADLQEVSTTLLNRMWSFHALKFIIENLPHDYEYVQEMLKNAINDHNSVLVEAILTVKQYNFNRCSDDLIMRAIDHNAVVVLKKLLQHFSDIDSEHILEYIIKIGPSSHPDDVMTLVEIIKDPRLHLTDNDYIDITLKNINNYLED